MFKPSRGLLDKERMSKCKKGAVIVNNAQGAIVDTQAVADACSCGHIAGYSGDVLYPQTAPKDHPWHYILNQVMTSYFRHYHRCPIMLDRYFKDGFSSFKLHCEGG
ncbi:putative formate dehydrogenase [Dioscorea sansibarensis]